MKNNTPVKNKKTVTKTVKMSQELYARVSEKAQRDFGFSFAELTRHFMASFLEKDTYEQRKKLYVEGLLRDSKDMDDHPENYKSYDSGEDMINDIEKRYDNQN